MITYEYPFNERIRTYLRLENLFRRLLELVARCRRQIGVAQWQEDRIREDTRRCRKERHPALREECARISFNGVRNFVVRLTEEVEATQRCTEQVERREVIGIGRVQADDTSRKVELTNDRSAESDWNAGR